MARGPSPYLPVWSLRVFVLSLLLILVAVDAKDLYKVLGVDKNANEREIKKAFHKQSLIYHPDKNKAKNAQSKFEEISHAYEILSDAEKRKQYDLTGDEKGMPGPGQGFGGPQGGGGNFGSQHGDPQFQSGGPFFQQAGPGGRTFTFTFGGPNQQGRRDDPQGWSQFFTNPQSERQPRQKRNSGKGTEEKPGWARNIYNKFTGNEGVNPGFGFGNFGNFGGGMFDNLFSSSSESGGEPNQKGRYDQDILEIPKAIEKLTPKNFKTQVLGTRKNSWIVVYFVPDYPGITDRLKVLASFAEEMKGILKIGAVDCEIQDQYCKEQGIQLFPRLVMYPLRAGESSKPVLHNGEWTVKALKAFYNKQFTSLTTSLDHQNFIEAMSKDPKQPRAILVRKTKDLPVAWLVICGQFENRIDFYDIQVSDGEDPIAKKLGAERFPAVVGLLSNGEQRHPDKVVLDKTLSTSLGALRSFLEKLEKEDRKPQKPPEGSQPVTFLTKSNMKKVCGTDSSLCIIATSKSSKGEEKAKQILNEISHKSLVRAVRGAQPVSYSLVDGAKRKLFLKAFSEDDLSSIDTVLVAYKPRRGRSALYRGPFTLEGVEDFVTKALGGDLTFDPVHHTPTL